MKRPSPSDLGKRMMNQALVVLAMIGVVIYFVYFGDIQPEEPVTLTITTAQGKQSATSNNIPLDVSVKLSNNTKEGIALTVPSQCDTFNWFLTGENKEFVQSQQQADSCTKQTVSTWLEGQHAMNEKFTLQLDPHRVHPGKYKLFVRYWGHEINEDVTIN
jgi:hypothetical protein